jgi:hypothetical protein
MSEATVSLITITSEQNESHNANNTYGTTSGTSVYTAIDDDKNYAFRVFTIVNYILGCTGVVTNLFVIIVILGFMEVKAKV